MQQACRQRQKVVLQSFFNEFNLGKLPFFVAIFSRIWNDSTNF